MTNNKASRRKVAFIGASYHFVLHQAIRDFILSGTLENTDVSIYDIDKIPLKIEHDVITRMIKQSRSDIRVSTARTRRECLEGADYVVVSVLVDGLDGAARDDKICRKYGIRHTVGDTIGPMCTARCLRQIPLMLDIAKDMRKYCPGTPLLSPTNPMAAMTDAVIRYGDVNCIGICHGTYFAINIIANSYKAKQEDVQLNVVGVNHLAFIDRVTIKGRQLKLPQVIQKITAEALKGYDDPAGHVDKADLAIQYAHRIGFIPNNGDHHFIEFFPWFLAPHAFRAKGRNKYGIDYMLDVGARRKQKRGVKALLKKWAYGSDPIPDMDTFSHEHIHDIILGLEGRRKDMTLQSLYLNVPNGRSVPNLPPGALLELTVNISKKGVTPGKNTALDTYRWGALAPIIAVNTLAVDAAVHRDKKLFSQALHLDPLTHNFDSIPKMADELWEASKPFFRAKK